jgi:hypothetical protein
MQMRLLTRLPGMTLAVMLTLVGAQGLVFGPEVQAESGGCSEATLRGAYGIQLQGTRPAGPDGPIESVVGVVLRVYDGQGHFTQVDNVKGSITGIVPDGEGSGTYEVAEDCTGMATLEPVPGIVITEKLVIVDRGLEVFSIAANPLPVMVSAVQKKIRVR